MDIGVSDHKAILVSYHVEKQTTKKTVISRNFKSIPTDTIRKEIGACEFDTSNITSALEWYNEILGNILEKHAPEKSKTIIIRPNNKWYDKNCRKTTVIRRRLERKKK